MKKTILVAATLLVFSSETFAVNAGAIGYSSSQTHASGASGYSSSQTPASGASGYSSSQTPAHASKTYTSSSPSGGYSSGGGSSKVYESHISKNHHHRHRSHRNNVSIAAAIPALFAGIILGRHLAHPPLPPPHYSVAYPSYSPLQWITVHAYSPLPPDVVVGGDEMGRPLFICRGKYRDGMHPGKVVGGRCNIGWGGREIALDYYQVLVSHAPLGWVSASYGAVPPNAVPGGYAHGQPLYICQVEFNGGVHPGKVVGQMCNIGWGNREVTIPYYNVLVM